MVQNFKFSFKYLSCFDLSFFSSLCSFQGALFAQSRPLPQLRLLMIPNLFPFVNCFFNVFQSFLISFFIFSFLRFFARLLKDACLVYIFFLFLASTFLSFFSLFFPPLHLVPFITLFSLSLGEENSFLRACRFRRA